VDRQRGDGVVRSQHRTGLQQLNAGYRRDGSGLVLNLVYSRRGASLPPLAAGSRSRLLALRHPLRLTWFALTNMRLQRFGNTLVSKGTSLATCNCCAVPTNQRIDTVPQHGQCGLAGTTCDCDFNQMLGLNARVGDISALTCDLLSTIRMVRTYALRITIRLHSRSGRSLRW
jgi:hypothetical protein